MLISRITGRQALAALAFLLAAEVAGGVAAHFYLMGAYPSSAAEIERILSSPTGSDSFRVADAKRAGYTDAEISDFLVKRNKERKSELITNIVILEVAVFVVCALILGGATLVANRRVGAGRASESAETNANPATILSGSPNTQPDVAVFRGFSIAIVALRFARGLIGVIALWQLLGLSPAITWLGNPGQVTGGMFAVLVVKAVFFALLLGAFFGLRWLINQLHRRSVGRPHPAMARKWSL